MLCVYNCAIMPYMLVDKIVPHLLCRDVCIVELSIADCERRVTQVNVFR